MKTVAYHIQKGGTGKTTMCGNTAFQAAFHKRTVMIDCDPQGNLSSWFLIDGIRFDLADVLKQKVKLKEALHQVRDNLWLLPTAAIDGELKEWSQSNPVEADLKYARATLFQSFDILVLDPFGPFS